MHTRARTPRTVTDDDMLELAAGDGFDLRKVITEYDQRECWGWVRWDEDRRWPAFGERRQAISWMRDRVHCVAVFR